ncbi:MAG TPA: hypothetical protein P5026_11595 [Kiritimatiellia bacterium]|nr:hypothetical protein [Kiritimatiellia bacterium]HRU71503.1 hypothetical protein [Kiritimatiellia bacterium]
MMQTLVIILWLLPFAAWLLPRMIATARQALQSRDGYAIAILAMAAAVYAYPSSADKGNPPPVTPSAKTGVIRLYHHAPDGRLVPLSATIREVQP